MPINSINTAYSQCHKSARNTHKAVQRKKIFHSQKRSEPATHSEIIKITIETIVPQGKLQIGAVQFSQSSNLSDIPFVIDIYTSTEHPTQFTFDKTSSFTDPEQITGIFDINNGRIYTNPKSTGISSESFLAALNFEPNNALGTDMEWGF